MNARLRQARFHVARLLEPIQAWRGEVIVICYACETHYPVSIRAIGPSAENTRCPACGAPWHIVLDNAAIEAKRAPIRLPPGGALARGLALSTRKIGGGFIGGGLPATIEREHDPLSTMLEAGPAPLSSAPPGQKFLVAGLVSLISAVAVVVLLDNRDVRGATGAWWHTARHMYALTVNRGDDGSDTKRNGASVSAAGRSKDGVADPAAVPTGISPPLGDRSGVASRGGRSDPGTTAAMPVPAAADATARPPDRGATASGNGAEHAVAAATPVIPAPAAATHLFISRGKEKARRSGPVLQGRHATRLSPRPKRRVSANARSGRRRQPSPSRSHWVSHAKPGPEVQPIFYPIYELINALRYAYRGRP